MKIAFALLLTLAAIARAADAPRPNIVYFLVDDLGRADVGFMGGKDIRTPNIDRLAKEGAVLDAFYVQPVCSPTRASRTSRTCIRFSFEINSIDPTR